MPAFSTRDIVTQRREWVVSIHRPWGAAWADVDKAFAAAAVFYREQHGLDRDATVPDDFARVFPGDDDIVIAVTVERPT